ncbi:hypothetical protein JAB5_42870 [Janthinobacterium sp. HH103]|uniref:DUF2938 domain-containing protein n=1 Tax=Janthinobacterium agaricidamnosum TaxID=55508 RepID=A0A3G2EFH4_9BURK|nr:MULTISPECIES: DUF2938 domain-containing protein [Janthinobacterium]AYM78998.1 DUF2938 domain-containing protein [Janthinobacterium agaricidamnosum]MCC7681553.1 DUF2938 domain-containing protein [Janthinobacterium sp. FW305-128]OEZ56010.1 hypothetical protein JAB2_52460 [Janthinobacterium sp. HH100]OEZ70677.1 hypothetical protein JAB5_42870 [Janthinobacterium sp. HH103]QOU70885.1 hypothetical protein JAB4_002780 [Janthinobacterium sp. HH102]
MQILWLDALAIGVGATAVMDVWAVALKRFWCIPSLNLAMVGRWLGHLPRGTFTHVNIAQAAPVRDEAILGWTAHYAIGVLFAAVLLALVGREWVQGPTFAPALLAGLVSVAAPFCILQPGMGAGLAASKTPHPAAARLRSLMAHTAFGIGLYLAALLWSTVR